MTKIYLVCATRYDECIPMAAYTDKDRADLEAERVRKFRQECRPDSGNGSCVYELSLDSPEPAGSWMAWINEDGSWDETYFEVSDECHHIDAIEMEMSPGHQRQWRGVGKTEYEAKRSAMDLRDKALKNDG